MFKILRTVLVIIVISPALLAASAKGKRPNILFIPIDDLKPVLGCYGNATVKTPNIDRLASSGTVFLNNSCQQAICGPSRVSLLTGLYPDTTRIYSMEKFKKMRSVNPNLLTLPEYFKNKGYITTGYGKTFDSRNTDKKQDAQSWTIPHTSHPANSHYYQSKGLKYKDPVTAALFTKYFHLPRDKKAAFKNEHNCYPATECTDFDLPDDAYIDGVQAKLACAKLEKLAQKEKPFFLSVGFAKPHLPFIAPKKYWDLYKRDDFELATFQKLPKDSPYWSRHGNGELNGGYTGVPKTGLLKPLPEDYQRQLIQGYYACTSYVDAQVGKLLDKVEELGIADNTIVVLWGDHGWHLGDHALWCKQSNYEQAVRSPLIISSPWQRKKGVKSDSLTEFVDIFPTLCELSNLPVPEVLEGKSLKNLLDNPKESVRNAAMSQYPRRLWQDPKKPDSMGYTLRNKRYRYVKWVLMDYESGARTGELIGTELYDYQNDPLETVNLAKDPSKADVVDHFEKIFKTRGVAQESNTLR
ncbi:sulfatase [Lentisphaera profundi]|uniref:Sulfatase n=1 Tax=Lentisphaera profundi TaxID=1658616 RepID=A0ABY7VWU7_9BACT|nr:sulfatase [Lentisphaera profundi]WDE97748.1 sulfatase [Lentisphaera profundi]